MAMVLKNERLLRGINMHNQIYLRIRNPKIVEIINNKCEEKNITHNGFINNILEEKLLNNSIEQSENEIKLLEEIKSGTNDNSEYSKKIIILLTQIIGILLNERSKSIEELKEKGFDPKDFYIGITKESYEIFIEDNEFSKELSNFIFNFGGLNRYEK